MIAKTTMTMPLPPAFTAENAISTSTSLSWQSCARLDAPTSLAESERLVPRGGSGVAPRAERPGVLAPGRGLRSDCLSRGAHLPQRGHPKSARERFEATLPPDQRGDADISRRVSRSSRSSSPCAVCAVELRCRGRLCQVNPPRARLAGGPYKPWW